MSMGIAAKQWRRYTGRTAVPKNAGTAVEQQYRYAGGTASPNKAGTVLEIEVLIDRQNGGTSMGTRAEQLSNQRKHSSGMQV